MSTTPRTDAARGFYDMDTAVSAEDMEQLETELAAAKAECAEKQATFDLMFSANLRGIKMWQDAHPEHSETWPDLAKLVAWLLSKLAAAKKRIADCEFVMDHRYKIIERQEQRCNEANARAKKAEADSTRLDWLDENVSRIGGGRGGKYTFFTPADVECGMLRDAIDAAMKEASK